MNVKERIETLIERHAEPGNDIDWIILSRLDFITLVFELHNHIRLDGIRIASEEKVQEGVARIVGAKGIKDVHVQL